MGDVVNLFGEDPEATEPGTELEPVAGHVIEPSRVIRVPRTNPNRGWYRPAALKLRVRQAPGKLGRLVLEKLPGLAKFGLWSIPRWFLRGVWYGIPTHGAWLFATDARIEVREAARGRRDPVRGRRGVTKTSKDVSNLMVRHMIIDAIGVCLVNVPLFYWLFTSWGWGDHLWLTLAPQVLALTWFGCATDERPEPEEIRPATPTDVGKASMTAVLRANGILVKPTPSNTAPGEVEYDAAPELIDNAYVTGQAITWRLPSDCGHSYADVAAIRDRVAGAFHTPAPRFWVNPGVDPGQFKTIILKRDPFDGAFKEHPLMSAERWDVWKPTPFAFNALGEIEYTPVVFTSFLIAAAPRKGKSYMARSVLFGPLLDPSVRWSVFDGKGGGTHIGLKGIAESSGGHFVTGADDEECEAVLLALRDIVARMRQAGKRLMTGTKITPTIARDPRYDSPVWLIFVDEAQNYVGHKQHGGEILDLLEILAKTGPSFGFVPMVVTQRPDAETLPSRLRNVLAVRLVLKVSNFQDSNIALGDGYSKFGFDASKLQHKGTAYFRPDADADGRPDADDSIRVVRSFYVDDDAWTDVLRVAYALRGLDPDLAEPEVAEPVEDENLTAGELFERLRAADIDVPGVTTAHQLGIRLGKLKVPVVEGTTDANRKGRERSRAAVEAALELPENSLRAAQELPTVPAARQLPGSSVAAPRRIQGGSEGSSETDPEDAFDPYAGVDDDTDDDEQPPL